MSERELVECDFPHGVSHAFYIKCKTRAKFSEYPMRKMSDLLKYMESTPFEYFDNSWPLDLKIYADSIQACLPKGNIATHLAYIGKYNGKMYGVCVP